MGLGGTVLGGLIGGFVAGPIGAIIGAGVGAYATRDRENAGQTANPYANSCSGVADDAHLVALFRSLGKMAKADGIVSQDEADFAKSVLNDLALPPEQRQRMIAAFADGKNTSVPFRQIAAEVAASFQPAAYPDIMRVYCMMALASGAVSPEEQFLLQEAESCFRLNGYSARFFSSNRNTPPRRQQNNNELEEAYKTLEISASATDAEVKKAWRKKAMEFHPDKIQGKGLPEAFINFANEETRRINAAYDTICKARGI